ncbi:MAG: heme-binding protein [Actinomycetota bacterium]|nr:heme-binding protein [Actinomycetota bacterium]
MTEQQPYEVVRQTKDYELRRYPACVIAEVTVDAGFDEAGSLAFRPLVNYIGGNNRSRESLAMTAPVVQSRKLDMTAPVVQQAAEDGQQVVAFVLPASVSLDSAPIPTDPRVTIREVPPSLTAVARYSGRWSRSSYDHHLAELHKAIAADGLLAVSAPRLARFDPPFKPWFLRRNEVHLDVAEPS